jgi:hypothetical protein
MARNGTGVYTLPANNPVITGTTISSTWANTTLNDIATALTGSVSSDGQTAPTANLPMATFAHTNVGDATLRNQYASAQQVQDNTLQHLTPVTGTNTITATAAVGMATYAAGQRFSFIATGSNTGATTLNINGIGAKAITKNGTAALNAGDIISGIAYEVIYDGTWFQLASNVANGTITSAKMANGGAEFGMRNRIINGAMMIDQRNAGASGTTAYTVDRWAYDASQGGKVTWQQNSGSVTPPAGFKNYLGVVSSSAYSITSSDYFALKQVIEGFNTADLSWGTANAATISISFWVRSSLTGTFGGVVSNGSNNRAYPFTYTISSANTWEQKTLTIAGDTSGTWATDNTGGIELNFGLGVGSTYSGAAGAWAAGNYLSATGATSVVGTNGATFYITGVQLEKGSQATAFEWRSYGTELALAQRYFSMTFSQGTAPASNSGQAGALLTANASGTGIGFGLLVTWGFPIEMRTVPTVTTYNPSAAGTSWFLNTAATVAAAVSNPGTRGVTVYNNATSATGTNAAIHLTASAEL